METTRKGTRLSLVNEPQSNIDRTQVYTVPQPSHQCTLPAPVSTSLTARQASQDATERPPHQGS